MLSLQKGTKVMVVKLDLDPEVQASLLAEAKARGLSLEDYLEQVVRDHAINAPIISAEQWEREFDAWVTSFPERPLLSDEAISRENMNPDRW